MLERWLHETLLAWCVPCWFLIRAKSAIPYRQPTGATGAMSAKARPIAVSTNSEGVRYLHREFPDTAGTLVHERPVAFGVVDSPSFWRAEPIPRLLVSPCLVVNSPSRRKSRPAIRSTFSSDCWVVRLNSKPLCSLHSSDNEPGGCYRADSGMLRENAPGRAGPRFASPYRPYSPASCQRQ